MLELLDSWPALSSERRNPARISASVAGPQQKCASSSRLQVRLRPVRSTLPHEVSGRGNLEEQARIVLWLSSFRRSAREEARKIPKRPTDLCSFRSASASSEPSLRLHLAVLAWLPPMLWSDISSNIIAHCGNKTSSSAGLAFRNRQTESNCRHLETTRLLVQCSGLI